ncbi:MAG: hypothetical protein GY934_10130 [Gammaproteobacteria bacterium]|nr:hypothetical protein [Gammaproteobacteria bacterium]
MAGVLGKLMNRGRGAVGGRFSESSANTTVHLLEMNRKFALFMESKVKKLEQNVDMFQARPNQRSEQDDDPAWFEEDVEENVSASESAEAEETIAPPENVTALGGYRGTDQGDEPPPVDQENEVAGDDVEEAEQEDAPAVLTGIDLLMGGDDVEIGAEEVNEAGKVEVEINQEDDKLPERVSAPDKITSLGGHRHLSDQAEINQEDDKLPEQLSTAPSGSSMLGGHYQLKDTQQKEATASSMLGGYRAASDTPTTMDEAEDEELQAWEGRSLAEADGTKSPFT